MVVEINGVGLNYEMAGDGEPLLWLRKRHQHGDAQIRQLFAHSRAFADGHEDVNFTPPYLAPIAANTLIVFW